MNNNLSVIWGKVLSLLEEETTPVGYNTWIKTMEPQYIEDRDIYVSVPSSINKNMVDHRYSELIKNALFEVTGTTMNLNVLFNEAPPVPQPSAPERHRGNGLPLNQKYTFETFVVGNSNRFAHAASLAVAEAPAMTYNPLFLYGGVGLGKTHLLHAIGNYVLENNPSAKIVYISSETFTNELINAIKDSKTEEFRNKYRSMDVLMVDDIQFIAGKKQTEEEFFHTFNSLYDANRQIIITSDRPPKEIKILEERLRSRFEWGLIGDISPPDYETRAAILRKKAQADGVFVQDDILLFIAEKITSNIRELEGAFNRVIAYRGLVNREITMDVALEALKDYDQKGAKKTITPDYIVDACSKFFNIKKEVIMGERRTKEVATARQIAMYLLRELAGMSHLKVGKYFDKHHTTIMYGINETEKRMASDEEFKETVETLIKDIKN